MHIMFTDDEWKWMDTKKFGCPIKSGCPDNIRRSLKKKKELLKKQEEWINGRLHQSQGGKG